MGVAQDPLGSGDLPDPIVVVDGLPIVPESGSGKGKCDQGGTEKSAGPGPSIGPGKQAGQQCGEDEEKINRGQGSGQQDHAHGGAKNH